MCTDLACENYILPSEATYLEVRDLHEKIVRNKYASMQHECKYPLRSFNTLGQSQESISTFEFRDGCRFLHEISDINHILDISSIFASMLQFKDQSNIPATVDYIAENSRCDGAHRLRERCLRHALDPRVHNSLYNTTGEFLMIDGSLYLQYSCIIFASFKADTYNTSCCFNDKDLLCCKCSCKAGGDNESRHICIHILPSILLLTFLLLDGLTESFLIELATIFPRIVQEYQGLCQGDKNKFRNNLHKLFLSCNPTNKIANPSVDEILQHVSVGTDKRFGHTTAVPLSELRAIRHYKYSSPTKGIQMRIQNNRPAPLAVMSPIGLDSLSTLNPSAAVKYDEIAVLQSSFKKYFQEVNKEESLGNELIGHKVLRMRTQISPALLYLCVGVLTKKLREEIIPKLSTRKRYHQKNF